MAKFQHANDSHADVRQALIIDFQQFSERKPAQRATIAEIAERTDYPASIARALIGHVGSAAAVDDLDPSPHFDDGFDWSGIKPDDRAQVEELRRLISSDLPQPRGDGSRSVFEIIGLDRIRLPWCEPEYRTIALRLLRVLACDPARPLDRRTTPVRIAAAIVWIALDASAGMNRHTRWKGCDLWDWFEVGSCANLGRKLATTIRVGNEAAIELVERSPQPPAETVLGDADLLHSSFRRALIERRVGLFSLIEEKQRSDQHNHPFGITPDGAISLASRPVSVRWAMRGEQDGSSRSSISVALGDSLDDIEVLAVCIPDARQLIEALEFALAMPALREAK